MGRHTKTPPNNVDGRRCTDYDGDRTTMLVGDAPRVWPSPAVPSEPPRLFVPWAGEDGITLSLRICTSLGCCQLLAKMRLNHSGSIPKLVRPVFYLCFLVGKQAAERVGQYSRAMRDYCRAQHARPTSAVPALLRARLDARLGRLEAEVIPTLVAAAFESCGRTSFCRG